MDKGTYILNDDKNKIYNIAAAVADASYYNTIFATHPLYAKLLMDNFKSFLNDSSFTAIERQGLLIQFLETSKILEPVQDIISELQYSPLKKDYDAIILEWIYNNSEKLVASNLYKYDGHGFVTPPIRPIIIDENKGKTILEFIIKQNEKEKTDES